MPGRRKLSARSSRSTSSMSPVRVVHDPQQPPEDRRQPVRQPVHRAEVEHAEPPVGQQPEVARVRVGVQQPGPGRAGEQEPGSRMPARSRSLLDPSLMIFDSGVPSIHSVTST